MLGVERPAGFEPATFGLEGVGGEFVGVRPGAASLVGGRGVSREVRVSDSPSAGLAYKLAYSCQYPKTRGWRDLNPPNLCLLSCPAGVDLLARSGVTGDRSVSGQWADERPSLPARILRDRLRRPHLPT